MTVSILSVSARQGDDIAVTFELREGDNTQNECFIISAAMLADMRLSVGQCSRECFEGVSRGAQIYSAKKRGLNILGYGTCSRGGLYRKLVAKGFSKESAKEAVAELAAEGYLNESTDALREAQRCVSKLWGKRRIAAALFQKGYSDGAVRSALFSLEEDGVDFAELCAERLGRTVTESPTDPKEKQKIIASLMRYGFTVGEIKEAFRKL